MSTGTSAAPRVVALGGGHGLAATLTAARMYAGRLTAVVSVADDGGSSGRLRRIAGIPAPGDLRRCLVAMAAPGSVWARAFEYRFPAGDIEGHALGNLLIAGLANVTGNFADALDLVAGLVGAAGRVLPATSSPVVLKAEVGGAEVLGQVNVAESAGPISSVSIVPPDAPVPAEVLTELAGANQVIMGPGSLFTSVLAVCVVPAIRAVLRDRRPGGRVYVCNLRPQLPETAGFTAVDHLRSVLDHGVPVDAMVAAEGTIDPGVHHGVRVVTASLASSLADGHSPEKLASVLASLT